MQVLSFDQINAHHRHSGFKAPKILVSIQIENSFPDQSFWLKIPGN